MKKAPGLVASVLCLLVMTASVCSAQVTDVYRDPNMDFGSIKTVAVMPFANLARDQVVAERVRDVFINRLLVDRGRLRAAGRRGRPRDREDWKSRIRRRRPLKKSSSSGPSSRPTP